MRKPPPLVAGIVLAAGRSRRMGRNKLLLQLEGEPLVRRAVRVALDAGLAPVIVVVGHEHERVREALDGLDIEFVESPDPAGSTSGSLHRGLERVPEDAAAAVLMLADMVGVTAEMVQQLVACWRERRSPVVASRYGDVVAPPYVFDRAVFAELRAASGEGAGRAIAERHRDRAVFHDWPAAALLDVDTPEDLGRARTAKPGGGAHP